MLRNIFLNSILFSQKGCTVFCGPCALWTKGLGCSGTRLLGDLGQTSPPALPPVPPDAALATITAQVFGVLALVGLTW